MHDPVDGAFQAAPRRDFLPRRRRGQASYDGPLDIGHGQTNSQPRTVEAMLRLLEVRAGDRVLDVGSGSGWTTALLAHLTGPSGEVVGVEIEPELVAFGRGNLARADVPWSRILQARSGVLGWPDAAPYDRILVSADGGRLPDALVRQLVPDGRMVLPVAGTMVLVEQDEGGPRTSRHGSYRFVPLV